MVAYTIATKWWWKKLLEKIKWELMSVQPEISSCHSEPFGRLRAGSAKNLIVSSNEAFEILRLTPQNDVVGQPVNYR